jgi:hypothetical protein
VPLTCAIILGEGGGIMYYKVKCSFKRMHHTMANSLVLKNKKNISSFFHTWYSAFLLESLPNNQHVADTMFLGQ